MLNSEFNEKYRQYLETGHYGMALGNSDMIEYMDKEFQKLIKIPGFMYSQIKFKFNWYCFYCKNVPQTKVEEITSKLKQFDEKL